MSKTGCSASYDRVPSERLQQLLAPEGFLAPLLRKRKVEGIDLEAHLRPENEIHVYCGLTCLVKTKLNRSGDIWVESHKTYANKPPANRLFRPGRTREVNRGAYARDVWAVGEPGFAQALETFLGGVQVDARQRKEGDVQARWSRITEPWIPFDKEAALAYPSAAERGRQLSGAFRPSVDDARGELSALAVSRRSLPARRDHWRMPPDPKDRLKLDQLAVDSAGNLVLLELKDASGSSSEVYYAPFQLLQNVWEWHQALNAVRRSLQDLLDVRVRLGLTPGHVPPLTGGIRAAVGFGDDHRSAEVRNRYLEVLNIANAHLPPGIPPIETWALEREQPVRLS